MDYTYKPRKDQFGLCLDWETSGSTWGGKSWEDYQGVSFGAAVFHTDTFEIIDTRYVEIKFDSEKYGWSAEAEKIHGLSREHLEANGISSEEAAVELVQFIMQYFGSNPEIIFLGHNANYDIEFTKQLLEPHGLMFNIANIMYDTCGVSFATTGYHRSDDMFHFLGLPERSQHNALEDVIYTIEAAKRIRLIFQKGLQTL